MGRHAPCKDRQATYKDRQATCKDRKTASIVQKRQTDTLNNPCYKQIDRHCEQTDRQRFLNIFLTNRHTD